MFKNLYKQANDKIDTSPAKQRVIDNLFTPKTKNHKFQYTAAMAACAALTFFGIGLFNENNYDNPAEISYLKTEIKQSADNDITVNENENKIFRENKDIEKNKPIKSDIPASSERKTKAKQDVLPEIKKENSETVSESSSSQEFEIQEIAEETKSPELSSVSSIASGDNEIALLSDDTAGASPVFNNITDKIVLPEGVEYISPHVRSVAENTEYVFSGNDKYIKITNSDKMPDTENYSEYKNSDGTVIYSYENIFTSYLHLDLNYTIYSENLTYTEFEQLINSLKF